MDQSDIKANLKLAKEALKDKNYEEALKYCKNVIKVDKNNYTALVFIGVSAQELSQNDQALLAFKRAVKESPHQVLAWQGLSSFYEKHPEFGTISDKIEPYNKLLDFFENDNEKFVSTCKKLVDLYFDDKDFDELIKTIHKAQMKISDDMEAYNDFSSILIDKVTSVNHNLFKYSEILKNTFSELISHYEKTKSDLVVELYLDFIKFLYEIEDYDGVENIGKKALHSSEASEFVLYLAKVYIFDYCVCGKNNIDKIEELMEFSNQDVQLKEVINILNLILCINKKKFDKISSFLMEGCKSIEYLSMISTLSLKMHQYEKCVEYSQKVITAIECHQKATLYDKLKLNMLLHLGKSLLKQDSIESITEFSKTFYPFLDQDHDTLALGAAIFLRMNDMDEVEKTLKNLSTTYADSVEYYITFSLVEIHKKNFVEAKLCLENYLSKNGENFEVYLLLARISWKTQCWREGYLFYLKAAKLDPYEYECFYHIGHYYQDILHDFSKASKCFKKAFDLNPSSSEVGCAYSDILKKTEENDENFNLLLNVTQNNKTKGVWAFHRLGIQYLLRNDAWSAICAFQNALRSDVENSLLWECLAEAYLIHGSYTAALKAFRKSAELNENSVYCLYRVGYVLEKLGLYPEAIEQLRATLLKDPNYIPTLKSLASSLYQLSKSYLKQSFNKLAISLCQEALQILSSALTIQSNLAILWKLSGDICCLVAPFSTELVHFTIPFGIFTKSLNSSKIDSIADKMEILILGSRCFSQALSLQPENSNLWHDFGLSYFYQGEECSDLKDKQMLYRHATLSVKKAITLNPSSHLFWNSLGLIATKSGPTYQSLAQHAFIQSIKLQENNALAWTNLGILYFKAENFELAHKAFKKSQAIEPSFANCWIAQSLIAEKFKHAETMDLFRHSTELSNHPEASIGYASRVCQFLKNVKDITSDSYKYNITELSAISAASDCLVHYTDVITNNPAAYNMLGILQEHQKLYDSAIVSYKRCIELVKDDDEKLLHVGINLARALEKSKQFANSLLIYRNLKLENSYEFLYKGDAEFYAAKFESAFQSYNSGKSLAPEEEKCYFDIALAMVLYKIKRYNEAKTLLLQCSQKNPELIESRLALCALGILQSDGLLATVALKECLPFSEDPRYIKDVALFQSYVSILKGNKEEAKKILCKFLHKYPDNSHLWLQLTSIFIHVIPENSNLACRTSLAAAKVGSTNENCFLVLCYSHLAAGHIKLSLKYAQKAVHCFPGNMKFKICLAVALLSNCWYKSKPCHCDYVKKLLLQFKQENRLCYWTEMFLALSYLHTNDFSQSIKTLDRIDKDADDNRLLSPLLSLTCYLQSKNTDSEEISLQKFAASILQTDHLYFWMVLLKIFYSCKKTKEMDLAVQKFVSQHSKNLKPSHRLNSLLILLAYLKFKLKTDNAKDFMIETLKQVTHGSNEQPICDFLQAICLFDPKKLRLAMKRLQNVFKYTQAELLNVEILAENLLTSLQEKKN